jgi:hypothetical protein
MPPPPVYEYFLDVEIPSEDVGTLLDALDDEPFGLREHLGAAEVRRRILHGRLIFAERRAEPFGAFEQDVGILSVYLSQYVVGREYVIEPTPGAPVLTGWKIVGRLGETERLLLDLAWDARAQSVVDNDEDIRDAARRWEEIPRWLQDALRAKHPILRAR